MRDDFTTKTKEILAKRVAQTCSNPTCRKITSGPNSIVDKATNIGVAAHITAATKGGPRYDETLNPEERKNISNGIWLCQSCSVLIDRDPKQYLVNTIITWKKNAENEILKKLEGNTSSDTVPFIEVDLIWAFGGRSNDGLSYKNLELKQPIPVGTDLYAHWDLNWHFSFIIHNNSEVPAFNLRLIENTEIKFRHLEKMPKINNIPPFKSKEIKAKYSKYFHGKSEEADDILRPAIPKCLEGLEIQLIYYDSKRLEHKTLFSINSGQIFNIKIY